MRDLDSLLVLGGNIQRLRIERHLSQEQLAEQAGLDRTYISSVERGRRNISILNILKIAGALAVPPASLLQGLGGADERS